MKAKGQFTFEAGLLLRRTIVRELRDGAVRLQVDLEINEDKGWLNSHFVVTFEGDDESVRRFSHEAEEYFHCLRLALRTGLS